jgi:hypothetical protein
MRRKCLKRRGCDQSRPAAHACFSSLVLFVPALRRNRGPKAGRKNGWSMSVVTLPVRRLAHYLCSRLPSIAQTHPATPPLRICMPRCVRNDEITWPSQAKEIMCVTSCPQDSIHAYILIPEIDLDMILTSIRVLSHDASKVYLEDPGAALFTYADLMMRSIFHWPRRRPVLVYYEGLAFANKDRLQHGRWLACWRVL